MSACYDVVYSPEALDDLRAILNYITVNLAAPQAGSQQAKRIQQAIRSLENMPMRHPILDWEPWDSIGIRKMIVDNYVVLYLVNEGTSEVHIVRIAFGGRNLTGLLESSN